MSGPSPLRRRLLQATLLGLGARSLPGLAALLPVRGFTHGIASGEPSPRSLLLWTRFVADQDTPLRIEVATDARFRRIVGGGSTLALAERDFTARLTIDGLQPGQDYHYRFTAPDGTHSPVGRARTLPEGEVRRFGLALFSCANLPAGWFNAYAHAAARDDLDLVVHVGDYLYEYAQGVYPDAKSSLPRRLLVPAHEMVTLTDHRRRYACYRADPDLQALHARHAMVAQYDDHELANDAWRDGAENHQPASEGDWATRRDIALRVWQEWMPVSDAPWTRYDIGSLATLFKAETRLAGRSPPLVPREPLVAFRDTEWRDPRRTLLGTVQEAWLHQGLTESRRAGVRWQVLAQQVVMGELRMPPEIAGWLPPDAPAYLQRGVALGTAAAREGLPFNLDSWGGFPAARERLLRAALSTDSRLVVLSGDSHNAWGNDLMVDGEHAGVEFACQAVSSPGYEGYLPRTAPADLAAALRRTNPGIAFCETSRRGYLSLQLTPTEATGTWHFLHTVRERDTGLATEARRITRGGSRRLTET
ncbi:MAG: hypothetical protein RL026_2260 [Pseudomonadota bacterium]